MCILTMSMIRNNTLLVFWLKSWWILIEKTDILGTSVMDCIHSLKYVAKILTAPFPEPPPLGNTPKHIFIMWGINSNIRTTNKGFGKYHCYHYYQLPKKGGPKWNLEDPFIIIQCTSGCLINSGVSRLLGVIGWVGGMGGSKGASRGRWGGKGVRLVPRRITTWWW